MKTLVRWASRLYPEAWRDRYGAEFEALVDDMQPSWRDLWDVTSRAIAMQSVCLATGAVFQFRTGLSLAVLAHAGMFAFLLTYSYQAPAGPRRPPPPLPPPAPAPPPAISDPRVFSTAYSSLPVRLHGDTLFAHVVEGVGIRFPALPDAGRIDRRQSPVRRTWPGDGLESGITRRVIPRFPEETWTNETVSVFVEYVISTEGFVKVVRTSGREAFARAARSAIEQWEYRPIRFEDQFVEVLSRVEVRFVGPLAMPARRPELWRNDAQTQFGSFLIHRRSAVANGSDSRYAGRTGTDRVAGSVQQRRPGQNSGVHHKVRSRQIRG